MIKSYNCFFSHNIFGSQWLGKSEKTFRYNGCLTVMNDIREGQQLAKMKKRIFRFRWSMIRDCKLDRRIQKGFLGPPTFLALDKISFGQS